MRLTRDMVRRLQVKLKGLGYNPGPIDGIRGRRTDAAIIEFKRDHGLRARPFVGPITWEKLFETDMARPEEKQALKDLQEADTPWMDEAQRRMGLHERRNHQELWQWMRYGGRSVGDPAKIPWCGDFVETAISRTLRDEPLPNNPYLAANWAKWGVPCKPQFGAVLVFWRGSPTSWKGHVGFYWGEDKTCFHVLGGNQSNSVNVARIKKNRLRSKGCRWPETAQEPNGKPRWLTASGKVSTNEA